MPVITTPCKIYSYPHPKRISNGVCEKKSKSVIKKLFG
jgi:hypothetical protein